MPCGGFRGNNRGRKAKHTDEFEKVFPESDGLAQAICWSRTGTKAEGLDTRASLQGSTFGVEQVVAVVTKKKQY